MFKVMHAVRGRKPPDLSLTLTCKEITGDELIHKM